LTQKSPNLRDSGRVVLGLASVLAITALTLSPAEARHYRARVMTHGHDYSPPSSAIVVDANSGNVLYAASPDELRHPASLTKIMTLYLLFERMETGKLKLDSELPVSEHASVQAPTKLGLKPGQTIAVEDAIKGLVTKSANDAAVVVAEAIGGTESEFAEMMTKKARAIGMSRTVYRNASGLPNDDQVTTARDQALLGRAIQERFPRQYRYFSTLSFTYHGESMRNHNMLLGNVDGVDGIKTGYTQASGFNLVTSVHRNNRHIVAVVLGGATAGARDAKMRSLIETHIASASTQHTATAIAEAAGANAETRSAAAKAADAKSDSRATKAPATYSVASFSPPTALPASKFVPVAPAENALTATVAPAAPTVNNAMKAPAGAKPAADANDTIKPIQVKTIKVKLTQTQMAGLGPVVAPTRDERADTVAEPVTAPPPRAPAPKAAAIAPPVAAPVSPVTPAPVTAPVVAAPVVAAPVAVAAAPVAPSPIAAPKTAPVAPYAPVAPAPAAAPASAPQVAAVAAPVAPASVAAPKTAPSAAYAPATVAAPAPAPPVAAVAAPVAPASVTVPKTAPIAAYAPAPVAAPAPVPPVAAVAAPVAPASVTVPKTAPIAAYAPVAAPGAALPVAAVAVPVAPASVTVPKTVAATPSSIAPAAAPVVMAWAPARSEASAPEPKREVAHNAPTHTGWIVQVGAFDVEHDAQQRLTNAHAKLGHVLDNADPFTEPVVKGDKTLYRARFAGFQQKEEADAVCKQLKRNDIDCIIIRN
jgi:D-alanyl-D-alanine carboxypeptidase